MLDLLQLLTFAWLGVWAFYAISQLINGKHNPTLVLLIVLFIFFGLPMLMDLFIGHPTLDLYPNFKLAMNDDAVSVIYCFYVAVIPVMWWLIGIRGIKSRTFDYSTIQGMRQFFWITLFIPMIAVLFAPDPEIYLQYGWVADASLRTSEGLDYQDLVAILAVGSAIAAVGLLASTKKIRLSRIIFLSVIMIVDIWLNGKRYIVAFCLLLIAYLIFVRSRLRRSTIFISLMVTGVILVAFSLIYQDTIRNITSNSDSFYTNLRIDYGRDLVTKLTLYAELYPEQIQIIPARGQSLLFNIATYIPRSVWPEKPFPYAVYLTSAVFNIFPARPLGWGLTTSWLEEAIANFSWLGLFIGPLVPILICRWSTTSKNSMAPILGTLVAVLFVVVQLSAFTPIFLVWIVVIALTKIQSREKVVPVPFNKALPSKQPPTQRSY